MSSTDAPSRRRVVGLAAPDDANASSRRRSQGPAGSQGSLSPPSATKKKGGGGARRRTVSGGKLTQSRSLSLTSSPRAPKPPPVLSPEEQYRKEMLELDEHFELGLHAAPPGLDPNGSCGVDSLLHGAPGAPPEFRGHTDSIRAITVDVASNMLVTASWDTTAIVWTLHDHQRRAVLQHDDWVNGCVILGKLTTACLNTFSSGGATSSPLSAGVSTQGPRQSVFFDQNTAASGFGPRTPLQTTAEPPTGATGPGGDGHSQGLINLDTPGEHGTESTAGKSAATVPSAVSGAAASVGLLGPSGVVSPSASDAAKSKQRRSVSSASGGGGGGGNLTPLIATACEDGKLSIWQSAYTRLGETFGVSFQTHVALAGPLTGLISHDSDNILFLPSLSIIYAVHTSTGSTLRAYRARSDINALVCSGDQLFAACDDGKIVVFDIAGGFVVRELSGHTKAVRCLCLPDDSLLISGSDDRSIKIWAPHSGTLQRTISGHTKPVRAVAMHLGEADRFIWSCCLGGAVRCARLSNGRGATVRHCNALCFCVLPSGWSDRAMADAVLSDEEDATDFDAKKTAASAAPLTPLTPVLPSHAGALLSMGSMTSMPSIDGNALPGALSTGTSGSVMAGGVVEKKKKKKRRACILCGDHAGRVLRFGFEQSERFAGGIEGKA